MHAIRRESETRVHSCALVRGARIIAAVCLLGAGGCGFFPEATFTLSPDSRLPRWCDLPKQIQREDVSVKMSCYIDATGRSAVFTIRRKGSFWRLAREEGSFMGLEPIAMVPRSPGEARPYPRYEIVDVRGIKDIVEHRAFEPVFYMCDDPIVWDKLLPLERIDVGGDSQARP